MAKTKIYKQEKKLPDYLPDGIEVTSDYLRDSHFKNEMEMMNNFEQNINNIFKHIFELKRKLDCSIYLVSSVFDDVVQEVAKKYSMNVKFVVLQKNRIFCCKDV